MTKLKEKPRIGFIGCGNMGQAFLDGLLNAEYPAGLISVTDFNHEKVMAYAHTKGVKYFDNNMDVAMASDVIIVAVKPDIYEKVIVEIRDQLEPDKIIVSIAPGISVEHLLEWADNRCRAIRTMPNTPVMVSQGCIAVVPGPNLTTEEIKIVCDILSSVGQVEIIKESLMDVFTAVCGSSPAYVFMFIEAMADAAVLGGMPRDLAYRVCSQAVLGSGMMVRETGTHPGALKDMVCSPGGTTIEAVRQLESGGFRESIWNAVDACRIKASNMAKK